ncbi:MAG: hypothetical protein ACHP7M_11150, partial [Burkholderiales bacterium]
MLAPPDAGGHESPFYPSFYPQEFRLETLDAAAAVAGWPKARAHAYVGADVFAGRLVPADATQVDSLGSYLVLTFDAAAGSYAVAGSSASTRCAAAGVALPTLAPGGASYVPHPYPVTPYHADYLEQFDLAQRAKGQYATRPATASGKRSLRIRAIGSLAATLVPPDSNPGAGDWDATLEEVDVDR